MTTESRCQETQHDTERNFFLQQEQQQRQKQRAKPGWWWGNFVWWNQDVGFRICKNTRIRVTTNLGWGIIACECILHKL